MDIGSICQQGVITVTRFDELTTAARLMREKHIGYLVVVEPDLATGGERPVGVLTDRDIVVAVVAGGADPAALRVGDVMTQQPVTVTAAESIGAALKILRRIGVRRLPVVSPLGDLAGVVSLDDIVSHLADELQDVAGSIHHQRRIEDDLRP